MAIEAKQQSNNQIGNFISLFDCIHQPKKVPAPMIPNNWKDKPMYLTNTGVLFSLESFLAGFWDSINHWMSLKLTNYCGLNRSVPPSKNI